ncbi:MAG: APC family permease [Pyrinomonadaceae bacterium]
MDESKIGLKDAVSIGIGGMVGGGIFAVLGLAVGLARGGTPVAFLLAGVIAFLTSYSYARLSLAFPDSGGTVKFVNQAFGKNVFSGGTNNLLWISYIVMLSLYASAFGSYGANLVGLTGNTELDKHLYLSGIVIFSSAINYISFRAVSLTESAAVYTKLLILGAFVIIGFYGLSKSQYLGQLTFSEWKNPLALLTGGMVIFVAYEGFELIANSVPNIRDPQKNVPRAFYVSVISVIILYVLIAIITVGSLSFDRIRSAEEYVLAAAAQPLLGQAGFTIITITALISTFSAINATLYGGSRVNYRIAENDELPHEFTKVFWNQPVGLLVTAVLTLLIANILNLESISTSGSAGFLLIFAIVNHANYKLADRTGSLKYLSLGAAGLCSVALLALIFQQFGANPTGATAGVAIILSAYLIEFIYKKSEIFESGRGEKGDG